MCRGIILTNKTGILYLQFLWLTSLRSRGKLVLLGMGEYIIAESVSIIKSMITREKEGLDREAVKREHWERDII